MYFATEAECLAGYATTAEFYCTNNSLGYCGTYVINTPCEPIVDEWIHNVSPYCY